MGAGNGYEEVSKIHGYGFLFGGWLWRPFLYQFLPEVATPPPKKEDESNRLFHMG